MNKITRILLNAAVLITAVIVATPSFANATSILASAQFHGKKCLLFRVRIDPERDAARVVARALCRRYGDCERGAPH